LLLAVNFVRPSAKDAQYLADNMRQCDIDELKAVSDYTPIEAVLKSIRQSQNEFLYAVYADEKLLCICGCAENSLLSSEARPWLLATNDMAKYNWYLTPTAKEGVRMMLLRWPKLANIVDIRNRISIRWLKSIGFEMTETLEIKPGYPVKRFELCRTT
jgi:hypothetical protein